MGYENIPIFPVLIKMWLAYGPQRIPDVRLVASVMDFPVRETFTILKTNATEEDLQMVLFLLG